MFTKMQLGIIKAVSTVLFQETETRSKRGVEYWCRSEDSEYPDRYCRVHIDGFGEDDGVKYDLYVRKILDRFVLVVNRQVFDEYDMLDSEEELCYIPLGEPERYCWELQDYAKLVEVFIDCD